MLKVLIFLVVSSSTAYADISESRAHFIKARHAYSQHDWAGAEREYHAAYAAHADPVYLLGQAQCARQQAHYEDAFAGYHDYLQQATDLPSERVADVAHELLSLVQDLIHKGASP